jgi:tetratricopeptide (TPR) repeat protein
MSSFGDPAALTLALSLFASPTTQLAAPDRVLALADTLRERGLADDAITEYRRYIFFNSERSGAQTAGAYAHMARVYRDTGNRDRELEALEQAIQAEEDDDAREERRVDLAAAHLALGRYDAADFILIKVETFTASDRVKSRAAFLRGVSSLYQGKWDDARAAFARYGAAGDAEARATGERIERMLSSRALPSAKSPALARALSIVVPGSGEMYAGQWRGGVNALLINAATGTLLIRDLAAGQLREALFDFNLLFRRFYAGNRQRAARAVAQFNAAIGEAVVAELLRVVEDRDAK